MSENGEDNEIKVEPEKENVVTSNDVEDTISEPEAKKMKLEEPEKLEYPVEHLSPTLAETPASQSTLVEVESSHGLFDEELDLDDDNDSTSSLNPDEDDEEAVLSRVINRSDFDENERRQVEDRKLMALLAHFSEDQLNCFETFRRATFPKKTVKRLMLSLANSSICQNVVIAMAGMTKVFIGELLDLAFDYRNATGGKCKLQPKHIREALRALQEKDKSSVSNKRNAFL